MPTASSPTEDFHRGLMTDPSGYPNYNGIPKVDSWNGDVFKAMNRLQNLRHSFQMSSRLQSLSKTGMEGQRLRLLAASGAKPAGPAGRIAGDLTNPVLVGQAIERYWIGVRNAGRPSTSLSKSIHGSLLADIYTVTGRFMHDITKLSNIKLRTDNDCALHPLYRALNGAAADAFGDVYGINGDEIEIYLKNQLIGLVPRCVKIDANAGKSFPDHNQPQVPQLVYLSDQEALACMLHIKEGRFWILGGRGGLELFDCTGPDYQDITTDAKKNPTRTNNTARSGNEKNGGQGVAGFAMGLNRSIYAHKHSLYTGAKGSFYHSAYMAGQDVLCTGCITVKEGKLTYINNASGHYEPKPQQLSLALQSLQSQGVDISRVAVELMNEDRRPGQPEFLPVESATDFLKRLQGAGFKTYQLANADDLAPRIRAALAAYETRANKFWSNPSQRSKDALSFLNNIRPDQNENLVNHVLFILGKRQTSPYFRERDRLDNNSELAKQLKRAVE